MDRNTYCLHVSSVNAYFQQVGKRVGGDEFDKTARDLGLAQKTGINVPDEAVGRLPRGNNNARNYSHGDGTEVTPLQLAVMVTAITNGGKKVVPKFGTSEAPSVVSSDVNLSKKSLEGLVPGMNGSAEYGTAHRGIDASLREDGKTDGKTQVAGKTGSCLGHGSWVGLFASVAPVQDPEYAVVVITRGRNERGSVAAGIAGKIYAELKRSGKLSSQPKTELALSPRFQTLP